MFEPEMSNRNDVTNNDKSNIEPPGGGPVGFGCGAILGFFIGIGFIWNLSILQIDLFDVITLGSFSLFFGYLAYKFGDSFFRWILDKLWWI